MDAETRDRLDRERREAEDQLRRAVRRLFAVILGGVLVMGAAVGAAWFAYGPR